MSEHMAGRTSGSVPTLTDHFKQALSMTRSQLQAGPSALSSASQMGVNGVNLNVPGTMNPMGSVSVPAVQPNAALSTFANLHTRPDIVYGAGQGHGQGALPNPSESSSGFVAAIQSYGKWIFLLLIVVAGVGAYFWWKKRQGKDQGSVSEEMQMPGRRPIHRSSGGMGSGMGGGMGGGMSIPIVSGGGGGGNAGGGGGSSVPPPFNPSRFHPGPSQHTQSPQPMPENLRDNEHRGVSRGAEFSNPSMVSHMMPMSTRVKPAEQTQNLPPQDIASPPPPRASQSTQQQSLPPIQSSLSVTSSVNQPPMDLPISHPSAQSSTQPSNLPPTHVPELPISQPPTQIPQSAPPQPNADPNFTVV
jgi:hypothetical protein